ncbi:MAG TPA: glycoside hydrolase family 43 protein [Kofleriaceae bacterium]|nr:glycoside hydrolase family 43 protein [Kofleriaceae bacterium]
MNRSALLSALAAAACGASTPASDGASAARRDRPAVGSAAATYQNPVVAENCPDPGVLADGEVFYAVCTSNNNQAEADKFPIRRSSDLISWERVGHLFPAGSIPSWAAADFWAPEIHRIGAGYVAYFTARDKGGRLSIGLATAPAVAGPWKDAGAPFIRDERVGMIDPHQFQDEDGTRYLYWKADGNDFRPPEPTPIFVQKLSPDGLTLVGERRTVLRNDQPWEGPVIEGGSVVRRGDWYYLVYSGNVFNSDKYAVGVARARSPLGPFEKRPEPILVTSDSWIGPGHGSLVRVGDADWYVYHAWQPGRVDPAWNDTRYPRMMLIDRIDWQGGWPIIHDGKPSSTRVPAP